MIVCSLDDRLHRRLSKANRTRLGIVRRATRDLMQTYRERRGYPVPLADIAAAFEQLEVGKGDVLLVHSSVSNLYRGASRKPAVPVGTPLDYARSILNLLLDLVGDEGTLLMPTDSVKGYFDFSHRGEVFDYETMPSRRGLVTELFRQLPHTVRSVNPNYNLTARGPLARELIEGHSLSEYTMDVNSPWYKLNDVGGKVMLLGLDFEINSTIHLCEYLYPEEYPRPLYYDKPIPIKVRTWEGDVRTMMVRVHAVELPDWALPPFCGGYLQEKYGIYTTLPLGETQVVLFKAKDQYDAVYREMQDDVCWYDARSW
ncbi:MAG: AAC(3) family N-acetyltransferase [Actinomycetota bacterium]